MNENKPRILSIDDEVSFTELIKQYFEPRGYGIDITSNGVQGIEFMRENKYDVALLDLKMEGLNGDEVMREIKRIDPTVKVIFITAYSDSGKTRSRLMTEGAFGFMEKPISSLKNLEDMVLKASMSRKNKGDGMDLKLLIVDDEVDICDFVKNFFKERNFEVFVAYDGKEALAIVESRQPDIILLDMKMPVLDGMGFAKEMKRKDRKAKIIMITAVDDVEKMEEAKKHGVVEYITKPLLLEQLERTVLTVAEQLKMEE